MEQDEVFGRREMIEAERFAALLDTIEVGGQPDVDALVDADLASLLGAVDAVREPLADATETDAFDSYRVRSRAYLLHTLEQQRRPDSRPAAAPVEPARIVPFIVRHRRWTVFAPVAAAAAAAGFALFTPFASAPGADRPANTPNLTAASDQAELDRISQALAALTQRSSRGEPVDASILRTITESASAVANRIETQPQTLSKEHVESYQRAVAQTSAALGSVQPAAGTADALAAAQRATEDGKVTAARYLGADATPATDPAAPATASTATPTVTATPTATPAPPAPEGSTRP